MFRSAIYPCKWALSPVTPPSIEPITLNEAKAQCRVELDNTYDDDYLNTLIVTARTYLEKSMGRRFINSTWDLILDDLPNREIKMPFGPLYSVTSVTYLDVGGVSQTLSSSLYVVDTVSLAGRIYPAYASVWPTIRPIQNSVTIRHVAGYGTLAANVPAEIKHAIKILCESWYEFRAEILAGITVNVVPHSVKALLSQDRQSWL